MGDGTLSSRVPTATPTGLVFISFASSTIESQKSNFRLFVRMNIGVVFLHKFVAFSFGVVHIYHKLELKRMLQTEHPDPTLNRSMMEQSPINQAHPLTLRHDLDSHQSNGVNKLPLKCMPAAVQPCLPVTLGACAMFMDLLPREWTAT